MKADMYMSSTLPHPKVRWPYAGKSKVTATVVAMAMLSGPGCAAAANQEALAALPLLTENDLEYLGAFRVPVGPSDAETFSYGGAAIAYNPVNDSLLMTGHVRGEKTAEISIPDIRRADNPRDLETADFLQPFADALEGKRGDINPDDPNSQRIGGYLVSGDALVISAFSTYDGAGTQRGSHFLRPLSLATEGQLRGPYAVGDVHLTSAYMAPIPAEWQAVLGGPALTGNCCRSIISNWSRGPAVAVFDPADLAGERRVKATPLLYYSDRGSLGASGFNLTTRIDGVVFPDGTRSILFFGRHGIGEYCYGEADACGDKAMPYKGAHAYPYIYRVWAYDALQLVPGGGIFGSSGRNVEPYAMWRLELPFESDDSHYTGGAAYDPGTGRIFFSQLRADSRDRPFVHVFRVSREADAR